MSGMFFWDTVYLMIVAPVVLLIALPYLAYGVDRLLHLLSAEAVSAWANVRFRM